MRIRIDDIVSDPDKLISRLNQGEEKDKTGRCWRLVNPWGYSNMANPYMPTYHGQSAFQ